MRMKNSIYNVQNDFVDVMLTVSHQNIENAAPIG